MKTYEKPTEVFMVRDGEWQARIGNEVLPTIWNSKGAALAGIDVECRRRGVHEMSRDCWCNPVVEPVARAAAAIGESK